MRSIILTLFVMNLFALSSFSQEKTWEWSIQSYSNCQNQATGMVIDGDNNCYLTGIYDSGTFQFGDTSFLAYEGDFRSFISSFDSQGNFRWAVSFQKLLADPYGMVSGCRLAVDSQQDVYVTGNFDFSVDFGDTVLYSLGNWDVFLAKYSSSGQFIWAYHIGGNSTDMVGDIKIDGNDNIFLGMNHDRPLLDNYIIYGNEDTTVYFSDCAISVVALRPDAGFSWLSCGTSESGMEADNLVIDKDNNLYAQFFIPGGLVLNGVTITGDLLPYTHVIIPYDSFGIPGQYIKFPQYWVSELLIDSQGDFISAGVINAPMIILGDTLVPSGNYDRLLVKYDHQMQPLWYTSILNNNWTVDFSADIGPDDGIYISAPFDGAVTIGDTTLPWEGEKGLFTARLEPGGNIDWVTVVPGTYYNYTNSLELDHCGNVYTWGGFSGQVCFGSDTLSTIPDGIEVYIAKLFNEPAKPYLGIDTLINMSDSLILSVGPQPASILWSDGSTGPEFVFQGEDYGPGSHTVWVQLGGFICSKADTIIIQVIDDTSVPEIESIIQRIYPNPATDRLYIDLGPRAQGITGRLQIEVLDSRGRILLSGLTIKEEISSHPTATIDISALPGGIYFLVIKQERQVMLGRKFVVVK